MKTTIALKVTPVGKLAPDWSRTVTGPESDLQFALVNTLCQRNDSALFPDRGTRLHRQAVSGAIYDANSARHTANFAALDTINFMRSWRRPDELLNSKRVVTMDLKPLGVENRRIVLDITARDGDNNEVTLKTTVTP